MSPQPEECLVHTHTQSSQVRDIQRQMGITTVQHSRFQNLLSDHRKQQRRHVAPSHLSLSMSERGMRDSGGAEEDEEAPGANTSGFTLELGKVGRKPPDRDDRVRV